MNTCHVPVSSKHVLIVGRGKLAQELLNEIPIADNLTVGPWETRSHAVEQAVVVHAGSGRELSEVIQFCHKTHSTLIELSTGSALESTTPSFPVVLCPNTNLLMLKFMSMLESSGHLFKDHAVEITESHQSEKTSVPGTAVTMALALGQQAADIISVRDRGQQHQSLQIPEIHLSRHAYHRILIKDAACSLSMETRVYGSTAYASGVSSIITAANAHPLENRIYLIHEFIREGWV